MRLESVKLPAPAHRQRADGHQARDPELVDRPLARVFCAAIVARAAALVLCDNDPSGDPTPSADDRTVTEQLVDAWRLLDIPMHDHVIIGRGRYVSFAEAGLL